MDFEQKLYGTVETVNRLIRSDALSTGDQAELRRINPEEPYSPALWKLILDLELDDVPGWLSQEQREINWAGLFMGMAMNPGLHNSSIGLGEALAESGWSELRFVRLLRTRNEPGNPHLLESIRRMASFLSSKDQETDWTDVGKLLFYQTDPWAESHRRDLSREYYRELHKQEEQLNAET